MAARGKGAAGLTTHFRDLLETFDNPHPKRDYSDRDRLPGVHLRLPEDRPAGLRHVDHPIRGRAKFVELKSVKLYLQQYRNKGIFYEDVTNRVLDDLVAVLAPAADDDLGRLCRPRGDYDAVTASGGGIRE